jgi:hypothetical protein
MSYRESEEIMEPGVSVKVDVTKIVKYVCIAGVLIVGIIFGTKCAINMLKINKSEDTITL